ncbi:hypothetical protein [Pseudodesulfovibrio indicus]|uniref:Uncharacterized protein n=1 Tax=Pseudodesulfovibrio indicus TaxID=1716143 RepID=A0A126QKG5_9BACT|nr:hypothetical protein [Pseudodesulfovibrio indicus]AMK10297.1 hypothetical protein AWY79_03775 [Pseudodesulfovibrio indicus]TDT81997.1 hypothetical protein EDC59_11816 [Pseudodesulfovibrio indicus]
MGSVVALDEFRQALGRHEPKGAAGPRPVIRGGDIWGRDYTQVEAMVFGLLKVREIGLYHAGTGDPELDTLCLEALDAAYRVTDLGTARLKATIKPLKEWLLAAMTEDNKRDISWALVLTDLIEKSPLK